MGKKDRYLNQELYKHICAWCNKRIPEGVPVFGLGVKSRPSVDLQAWGGKIIPMSLVLTNKTVPAMVTTSDSDAKREGKDLMFMTCSQACAESLKDALEKEKALGDSIIGMD